jgi:hypothetical protein
VGTLRVLRVLRVLREAERSYALVWVLRTLVRGQEGFRDGSGALGRRCNTPVPHSVRECIGIGKGFRTEVRGGWCRVDAGHEDSTIAREDFVKKQTILI